MSSLALESVRLGKGIAWPSAERVQAELNTAESMDDFFGKDGIFARLFAQTLEQMLAGELTAHLGYEKYQADVRGSRNSRNGSSAKTVRTSAGPVTLAIPRDRNNAFTPQVVKKYETSSNELEDKIVTLYGKGMTVEDVKTSLRDMYGVEVSDATITAVTDKVLPLVQAWQTRPLANLYPIVYLDALYVKLKRNGRIENTAVYNVLGVDMDGRKDCLGHWIGDGAEGAKYWMSVLSELQARGVKDILIACMDGLTGFPDALRAVFPQAVVQTCIVHQIRNSLKYVVDKDRKPFARDLKTIYRAASVEEATSALHNLEVVWGAKYSMAVKSWLTHWTELSACFQFPAEIRRLIYTNNSLESYHRQLRKVTKTRTIFPTDDSVRKVTALPGLSRYRCQVDHAHPALGDDSQSTGHRL